MTDPTEMLTHWTDGRLSEFEKNRQLFHCLCDDALRAKLYAEIKRTGARPLEFQSRAPVEAARGVTAQTTQQVFLLTSRDDIETALTDDDVFGNDPYHALGSGTFMLGLDGDPHMLQRAFAFDAKGMCLSAETFGALAGFAFKAAATLPLKQGEFDLVALAEQAALRFVGLWFGLSPADHLLLQEAMRAAYKLLNFQIIGRHFVTDPTLPVAAGSIMAKLLTRLAELLDDPGAPDLVKDDSELAALLRVVPPFRPLLRELPDWTGDFSGTERAVVAFGLLSGAVGNVQAGVSIAINAIFEAHREDITGLTQDELTALIADALRRNPPAAFLPRRTKQTWQGIPAGSNVILAMEAAANDRDDRDGTSNGFDALIFGGRANAGYIHQCLGERVARPLICQFVKQVLALPGLSEGIDSRSGARIGLSKTWGVLCKAYPLAYLRQQRLLQQPLNVVMRIRMPTFEHAEALKKVIATGAPRIELRLTQSRHVHFAWFLFIENDTKLALFTTYDGDFDAYIEHFALAIGPLFDKIFEHIEDAPALPVDRNPKAFVDAIRRYNAPPAAGYFFSAYPTVSVASIVDMPKGTS